MTKTPLAQPGPLALAALSLALVGCFGFGGSGKPTSVWSLRPTNPVSPSSAQSGPALGVESFTSNAELRTTDLIYRVGDGMQLLTTPGHEWADFPDSMVRERTVAALASSRQFRQVSSVPPREGLDAVLVARLVEFDEWDLASGPEARVGLRWRLETADGELIERGLARATVEAREKSVEAVVKAFDEATAQVAAEITGLVVQAL